MDFTPKNIKMCEKAEEIQKLWRPQVGDFFISPWGDLLLVIDTKLDILEWQLVKEKIYSDSPFDIWIPHQDQLQQMGMPYKCSNSTPYAPKPDLATFLKEFYNFCFEYGYSRKYPKRTPVVIFDSIEQLLLAFVMLKEYGKIWDDEKQEWIHED